MNYYRFLNARKATECYFIDLPGYGYARASKEYRDKWSSTIKTFLHNRSHVVLRRVYLLIDSRHTIKDSDVEIMDLLNDCELSFQIILTKADLSTHAEKVQCLKSSFEAMMSRRHACGFPIVHVLSSHDGAGLDAFKQSMTELIFSDIR